jgi:hypothetical protein
MQSEVGRRPRQFGKLSSLRLSERAQLLAAVNGEIAPGKMMPENSREEQRAYDPSGGATPPEEVKSIEEKAFEGFSVVAAGLAFVVPAISSGVDFCRGPIGLLSGLPMIHAFVEYKYILTRDICSFEWAFLYYTAVVVIGFLYFGRPMPPLLIRRVKARRNETPNFWNLAILTWGFALAIYVAIFLICQYSPSSSVLDAGFVGKNWYLMAMALCGASFSISFGLSQLFWSIFNRSG